MGVAVPLKTIEELSGIHDPEEWKRRVFDMFGNAMPEINGDRVYCAVYIGPDVHTEVKRKDGTIVPIYKSADSTKEDIWQSKMMMVVALGNAAYVDTTEGSHYGFQLKPGDWVSAQIHNCSQEEFRKMPMRTLYDWQIEKKWNDPRDMTS